MDADDALQIFGLAAIIPKDRVHSGPSLRLPERMPGIERAVLTLWYRDRAYPAHLAGTAEAAEKRDVITAGTQWRGWAVLVTSSPESRGGGQMIAPLPTLEAAVLAALSAVVVMDHK